MKQYLINEEELRELLESIAKTAIDETDPIIDDSIFAFKLSKKPVRLIATGRIYYFEEEIDIGVGNMPHLEYGFNGLTQKIAKENESCPAQLFIEEDK